MNDGISENSDRYRKLRDELARAGIFKRQPVYYSAICVFVLGGLALCAAVFSHTRSVWALMAATVLYTFVSVQLGFLIHDAGHGAIFDKSWKNDIAGLIAGDLLSGISYGWWKGHHAKHHINPNHAALDPDIPMIESIFALTSEAAFAARGYRRWTVRFQAWLFPPALFLESLSLKFYGTRFLLTEGSPLRAVEWPLLALHYGLVGYFLFHWLGWTALIVIAVQHAFAGFYLAAVLASNHMGRPIIVHDERNFFRRQIWPTRNLKTHPASEFFWGGLNHQIEHHLFPSLSRNQIQRAMPIVRKFCAESGLAYEEETFVGVYREIILYLDEIGSLLKPRRLAALPPALDARRETPDPGKG